MSARKPLFAFFGTPRLATTVLSALESKGFLPSLIVTAPDKPQGRGLQVTPSPAKVWGQERGIDVITPSTLKEMPDIETASHGEGPLRHIVVRYIDPSQPKRESSSLE